MGVDAIDKLYYNDGWLDPNIECDTEEPVVAQVTPLATDDVGSGKKVLYKRSSANEDGKPKLPSNMEYGELSINYGDGVEVIAIKNSSDEIITFIPLRAFLEAPVVEDADYLIGVEGNEIVLYDYNLGTYRFVGSDAGDSVVVIDGEDVTVPANETVEGTFYDITEIKTNNLKEVYIYGDATTKFCESSLPLNYTLEIIHVKYTGTKTTDASNLCYNLHALKTAEFINLRPSSLAACFRNCENLETLESSTWNLSECESLDLFICISNPYTNDKLKTFDTSGWDTSKVTSMRGMFQYCTGLEKLDVSNWDTSSVTTMYLMFGGCTSLEELDVSNWNTSNVTTMESMFSCYLDDNAWKSSLKQLDVSNWDTSKVTNMMFMFIACTSLEDLDVSQWDTSNVTDMRGVFADCESLKYVNVSNWDTSKVTDMAYLFGAEDGYEPMVISNLDVSNWDTSNVTNMAYMFGRCKALEAIDVSKWNVSKVTDMNRMFGACVSLKEFDLSSWDVSNVTDMTLMLGSDDKNGLMTFKEFNAPNWNTSKVASMESLFQYCGGLETVDATYWDTSNTNDMRHIFQKCGSLNSVKCGDNWNLGNLDSTSYMFYGCTSLRTVEGGINNIKLDIDLSDSPLSRLSALTFVDGFYDYSSGDEHTCKFADYTVSTLLEEDFSVASTKNWNVGTYESHTDEVGDVIYWNTDQRRMMAIKPEFAADDNYPTEQFPLLGVMTVPTSHNVYGNGDGAMVSLALMDCNNPDKGNAASETTCKWGYVGTLVDVEDKTCAMTGTTASPTTELTDVSNIVDYRHLFPSDSFDTTQCPTDPTAYYSTASSTDYAAPSPYLEDGSSNNVYTTITQTTAVGDVNMLSEFDGMGNTAFITDSVTVENWKTADTISDSADEGNYPAAMCCWRYDTGGVQQGEWYLPAIGELGYLAARAQTINNTMDAINDGYGTVAHKLVSGCTWSSSEYSSSQSIYVDVSDGLLYPAEKTVDGSTRAFCHVNFLGYNYYFVGGAEDSVVTIDGENVTIPANEEVYGYCSDDISDIPTNNLKEIHIYCDVSLRIGSEEEIENYNTTVEVVEVAFSGTFERDFTSFCRGLGALKSAKFTGGIADSVDYMFNWCENMTEIDVNGINTRRCTNLEDVFSNCKSLADIDLSKWDVSQVVDFRGIFYACPVTELDVADWNTSNGENFWGVFDTCNKLTYLDLSGWDTGKAKTFRQLFNGCTLLNTLVLGDGWDCQGVLSDSSGTGNEDNSFYRMFRNCSALTTVLGSIKNIKVNIDLSACPLTRESALIFINGLAEVSGHTISLSSTTKGYLTDADLKIATDKGWTVG